MQHADLTQLVDFEDNEPTRRQIFESDHLWSQLVCLGRNQTIGPMSDPEADAMLTVVAGEVVFLVDKSRQRKRQWGAVLVPGGSELYVKNASADPAVVLLVTAPPPSRASGETPRP